MANFYEDLAGELGSDVESEVSDVNPAEMAKMLQDLDDMESDLFKSKKPSQPSATVSSTKKGQSTKNEKPHVRFNNPDKPDSEGKKPQNKKMHDEFDWDDPLADILSSDESVVKSKQSSNVKIQKVLKPDTTEELDVKGIMKDKNQKGKLIADLFREDGTKPSVTKEHESTVNKTFLEKKSEEPKSLDSFLDKSVMKQKDVGIEKISALKPQSVNSDINIQKTSVESDDFLKSLGLENDKKTGLNMFGNTSTPLKTKSLMDDIFSNQEVNKNAGDLKRNASKEDTTVEGPISFGSYAPSVGNNRESRRSASKRETSSIGDPLGLFTPPATPSKNQTSVLSQKQMPDSKTSTPLKRAVLDDDKSDWLGLSSSKDDGTYSSLSLERKRQTTVIENKPTKPPMSESISRQGSIAQASPDDLPEWLGGKGTHSKQKRDDSRKEQRQLPANTPEPQHTYHSLNPAHQVANLPAQQGLTLQTHAQMEQEAAYALQLQEQQLRTALHLRQHEAQMAGIHERQRALIGQQERQMQQLLAQQTQRQQQLELQLQVQQKRIADYMQVLVAQPTAAAAPLTPNVALEIDPTVITSVVPVEEPQQAKEDRKESALESNSNSNEPQLTRKELNIQITELQVTLQQCELEKKALESTLESLQTKHKEEVQLLEDCYKRQISILEEAMEKHSSRLKAENERIETDYKDQFSKIQEQQLALVETHAQQLAAIQKDHIADMQALKDQHNELLKHVRFIQHAETNAVKEASLNINVLQSTVEQLGKNTDNLSEMQIWLEKQSSSQSELRELSLKAKESEVLAYKENLLKQREAAEEERRKLLGLVEQLEMQIVQQRTKAEEERFSLRQETARLDARIEAFEREKEHAKGEIERERQHVEKARQLLLQEQKAVTLQFKEEKMVLAQERARIQALTQLHGAASASQEQVLQLKAEAEAALAVAKEATEQVDAQRAAILEQQKKMDKERQRLQEMEHTLTVRTRELDALSQAALITRNEGADALANAAESEERQKQRAADLQRQLNEIRDREQRLSEERAALSQERMKLHRNRDQKVCLSCKSSLKKPSHSEEPSFMSTSETSKFVDPKLVILKLVAEKERDALLSNSLNLSAPK